MPSMLQTKVGECCLKCWFCTCLVQFIQTELAGAIGDSFLHSLGGYMSMDMLIKGVCVCIFDYTSRLSYIRDRYG